MLSFLALTQTTWFSRSAQIKAVNHELSLPRWFCCALVGLLLACGCTPGCTLPSRFLIRSVRTFPPSLMC